MTRACILPLVLALGALGACDTPQERTWLGYVEGETALIAPPQPGWMVDIAVARGEMVSTGDLLFALDDTRELAARDNALAAVEAARALRNQAMAALAQANAQLDRSERELVRQQGLVGSGASPQRDLEQAQANRDSARALRNQVQAQIHQAEAQIDEAEAMLVTAEWTLSERAVQARVSGEVQDIYFRQGEYANAGTPVVSILPPGNIFVRFFVPETDVGQLNLGDGVRIGCDGCPPDLTANISFIAAEAEFTPPIIYSVTNRQRLVFKVEARTQGGLNLRPGLPVDILPVAP